MEIAENAPFPLARAVQSICARMLDNRLARTALISVIWLPFLACSSTSSSGGSGGTPGTGGSENGGMTGTGGTASGGMTGSGGAHDAGPPVDAGHDTSGGGCWAASDCHNGAFCSPPGQTVCGGACLAVMNPCTSDLTCATDGGAPRICEVVPCSCPSGMGCVAGCTSSAECPEGQTCIASHHCVATPCGQGGPICPTDFVCLDTHSCTRKSCTSDSQCSNSCVLGQCYHSPGTCRLAAP